jgi:hypothetical protein
VLQDRQDHKVVLELPVQLVLQVLKDLLVQLVLQVLRDLQGPKVHRA